MIRAMRAVLPPSAVLGGLSAAWALGVLAAGADDPVEVILPPGQRVRSRPGLNVRGDVLHPGEVIQTPLGAATSGLRTAFDLGRRPRFDADLAQALTRQISKCRVTRTVSSKDVEQLCRAIWLVDALLRQVRELPVAVGKLASGHPGLRGQKVLRVVLGLADPRAESPPESILRTRIILGGLPWPIPQYEVMDPSGVFVARVDLGWPRLRLAVEYDGAYHDEAGQIRDDRLRDIRLQLAGWQVLHIDSSTLRLGDGLLQMLHRAMQR